MAFTTRNLNVVDTYTYVQGGPDNFATTYFSTITITKSGVYKMRYSFAQKTERSTSALIVKGITPTARLAAGVIGSHSGEHVGKISAGTVIEIRVGTSSDSIGNIMLSFEKIGELS